MSRLEAKRLFPVETLRGAEGWAVNHKRVERIWRQEGLKVPSKQPKRGRLWLTDGSCIRLRPLYRQHVWAYDFVADRTHDGRPLKMLTVLDEYSRECLAIVVARSTRQRGASGEYRVSGWRGRLSRKEVELNHAAMEAFGLTERLHHGHT